MGTQVDLRQLAVDRPTDSQASLPRKRSWLTRWCVPLTIIAGFLGIVGWSARDHWLPAKSVTVIPVVLAKAEIQASGAPLFQAAGWVEPRPTAVIVSALAEGIVDELLVVEGQEVKKGQPIARLVDAEVQIALREAGAVLQLREAERAVVHATLVAARLNMEQPAHLEAALADAEAVLAQLDTEIKNLPFAIRVAESRLQLARQDLEGKKSVSDAIAGRAIQKAQSEVSAATAAVEELRQRGPSLETQREATNRKCAALKRRLSLRTDEKRALDEATANLASAEAKVLQAQLAQESAQLRLDRMTVRAPIAGRVLSLNAPPGRRLMGLNAASERDASTVVTLYDPERLQVRADVRLEDVPQVQIGQPVQITTPAANQTLQGHVIATTSQADIQKNTLQVKVSIDNPHPAIRPEMLAQVIFLAPHRPETKSEEKQDPMRLLVARELIETADGGSTVWVADLSKGIARRQPVQMGQAGTEQLVEVAQGLSALDKLIVTGREGLKDGDRIRISGEDRMLGNTRAQGRVPTGNPK